jgi:hypothetical protein
VRSVEGWRSGLTQRLIRGTDRRASVGGKKSRLTHDPVVAEDIVQDACFRALLHFKSCGSESEPRPAASTACRDMVTRQLYFLVKFSRRAQVLTVSPMAKMIRAVGGSMAPTTASLK